MIPCIEGMTSFVMNGVSHWSCFNLILEIVNSPSVVLGIFLILANINEIQYIIVNIKIQMESEYTILSSRSDHI